MSPSYRVLLVSDSYAPLIGGADTAVRLLALELSKRGHDMQVATAWQRGLPASERLDGIQVHRLRDSSSRVPWVSEDPYKHHPPPYPDPEAVLRFRRLLARVRPDVVHSYGWLTYSCRAAITGLSVPLVLSVRDWGNFCALRTLLQYGERPCSGPEPGKCLDCAGRHYGHAKGAVAVAGVLGGRSWLAERVDAAHFNSAFTHRVAWQHLFSGRAAFAPGSAADAVIPNFLPDQDSDESDAGILARLPEDPYILFVGAFRRVKGIEQLLAAYRGLPDPPPLVLIGTRESDTPETFPPEVTVLESVPRGTVLAAWRRALFGVSPSTVGETFGNVVHEAMSQGRPVIGTRPSGHEELILDRETGFLVPRDDVGSLAEAMHALIRDSALRERMGAAARERAALFSAEHAAPRFEALYQTAIATSRSAMAPRGR